MIGGVFGSAIYLTDVQPDRWPDIDVYAGSTDNVTWTTFTFDSRGYRRASFETFGFPHAEEPKAKAELVICGAQMSPLLALVPAILVVQALVTVETAGLVLTSSDISSDHRVRRPVEVDGRSWLGLYPSGSERTLAPASPHWTVGKALGDSTFALVVDPPDPVLLLADVPSVLSGSAPTLTQGEWPYTRGQRVQLALGDRRYSVQLLAEDPTPCDARVVLSDGRAAQDLYASDVEYLSCDEPHFTIEWAGVGPPVASATDNLINSSLPQSER